MKFRSIYLLTFSFCFLSATQIHSDRFTAFKDNDEGQSSKVFALKLPEIIDFAGEVVPIEFPDIKERFDKELLVNTYWQSNMLLLLKRANKYFPLIEKILEEEGVPDIAIQRVGGSGLRSDQGISARVLLPVYAQMS